MTHFKGEGYSSMAPDLHLENVTIESLCCLEGSVNAFLVGWVQRRTLGEENGNIDKGFIPMLNVQRSGL